MAQDQNIDLFGNTMLTPRQIIQQQLAKSVSNTEALYKDAAPVNRAAAIWGSGLGGLFRQALQEKGIIDKDPEVKKAEQAEKFRRDTEQKAKELGIKLDPQNPSDWAGKMASIGLQAIQQTNEDGSPKYPELQDMAPRLLERYIQSQAAQEAARLKAAQVKTEEGKPTLQEAQAEEARAKADKARDEIKEKKTKIISQFNGEKWQDYEEDKYGNKVPSGKPYDMSQKLKSTSKGESDNPARNTALNAVKSGYNFKEGFGIADPKQLPAFNRALVMADDFLAKDIPALKASSMAISESQKEHEKIQARTKLLSKHKINKDEFNRQIEQYQKIIYKITDLRNTGLSDDEIKKQLKEAGLNPEDYLK